MKKLRYSDSQVISILKQAEVGTPVTELCREHGMSDTTFYKWRAKFGGMDGSLTPITPLSKFNNLAGTNRFR
jgi:putative transposase